MKLSNIISKLTKEGYTLNLKEEVAKKGDFSIDFSEDIFSTFTGASATVFLHGDFCDYTIGRFASLKAAIESGIQGSYH